MAALAAVQPKVALAVIDMQEDFCEPNGSLAIKGARELAPVINSLLTEPGFALKIATQDWHPADHVSFASQHKGAVAFESRFEIRNPENEDERAMMYVGTYHIIPGDDQITLTYFL